MRKIVITQFISLDGVIEAPGGEPGFRHAGWTFAYGDPEGYAWKGEEIMSHDAVLLGRVTYQGFAAAWPGREDDFAHRINAMPKYVVTNTLTADDLTWESSQVISGDVAEQLRAFKAGGDETVLLQGSIALCHLLNELDLVDEYRLMVFPVVLGTGRRLFGEAPDWRPLTLVEQRTIQSTGTQLLVYARNRDDPPEIRVPQM